MFKLLFFCEDLHIQIKCWKFLSLSFSFAWLPLAFNDQNNFQKWSINDYVYILIEQHYAIAFNNISVVPVLQLFWVGREG